MKYPNEVKETAWCHFYTLGFVQIRKRRCYSTFRIPGRCVFEHLPVIMLIWLISLASQLHAYPTNMSLTAKEQVGIFAQLSLGAAGSGFTVLLQLKLVGITGIPAQHSLINVYLFVAYLFVHATLLGRRPSKAKQSKANKAVILKQS